MAAVRKVISRRHMMSQSEMPAACSAAFQSVTMDFAGTVTYAAGTETANMTSTTHVSSVYTAECISAMAGQTIATLTEGACDAAEQSAAQNGGTATCSLVGSACNCAITIVQTIQETDTYTMSGSTITYSDGSTLDFCVAGSKLRARGEIDAGIYVQYTAHR